MFEVRIDGIEPLLAKLSKYSAQVNELHRDVPAELESWQREDMKRKYPNMQVDSSGAQTAATTYIWPRSRAETKRRRYQGPKLHRPQQRGPVVRSSRPILRATLLEQLYDRMRTLVAEATKWP